MNHILLFGFFPLLCIICFYIGWVCGKTKRKMLWTIPPALFILALYLLSKFPQLDYYLFPFYTYGRLRFFIPLLPLLWLFGIAAQFRPQAMRRILYSAFAGFGIVVYLYVQISIALFDYDGLHGRISESGCCMQSTAHTCGPAAAVTLLRHFGITATESQMAKACGTSPLTGTNEFVLCSIMNRIAKQQQKTIRFEMKAIPFTQVDKNSKPFMAVIKLSGAIAHWIVIRETTEKEMLIADPLCGVVKRKKTDYQDLWFQRCIVVNRKE